MPVFSCPQLQVQDPLSSGFFFPQLEQKFPVFPSCPQEQVHPDNGAIFAGTPDACRPWSAIAGFPCCPCPAAMLNNPWVLNPPFWAAIFIPANAIIGPVEVFFAALCIDTTKQNPCRSIRYGGTAAILGSVSSKVSPICSVLCSDVFRAPFLQWKRRPKHCLSASFCRQALNSMRLLPVIAAGGSTPMSESTVGATSASTPF